MSYQDISYEVKGPVARIVLNLPESGNALRLEMRGELLDAFGRVAADDRIRAVVLAGAGKNFCSGGDLRTMEGVDAVAGRIRLKTGQRLIRAMLDLEKPIVGAVQGYAAGAGVSLAMACDLVLAASDARISVGFVRVGLIPDWGLLYFLPLRVGVARAKAMMMTGEPVSAEEAERVGLVYRVVPQAELETEAMDLAARLAAGPAQAYAMIKSALNRGPQNLESLLEMESAMQAVALTSQDFDEGRRAFLEKRKPTFQGK